ncbi:MAG: UDP-N-acetylmuramoyl-L-alanyl-D-glutamate--2,6-diaminopimelate ligase [Epsilonproteobacteria bacterium]|nr:UDP-N-acetylmuramoyl-L-alanyl-D-glutamate--2,6-diaminopimelate ligase [Campylobacterota bacterium]NPA57529.1 UDP-N-acetylmuramoyl-L-alanyl-D-glutamate--2,6-diaminopimelate ligase [Campylobacterota bacterium]
MIYEFGGVKVSDDTREAGGEVKLLATAQNARYRQGWSGELITPQELVERFSLDSVRIVGVTGTNGKTTTTAAIYSILKDLGYGAALQGTRGFLIDDEVVAPKSHTTPPIATTLYHLYLAQERGAEFFVMEVSSHAIDQKRIEGLPFSLKVITNISQDHLDYHGSMERYIATKNSFLADGSPKLVNRDDRKIQFNPKGARTYGVEEMATYKVTAYSLEGGISAILQFGREMVDFHSPLMGLFNLYNLTAAIGAVHMVTDRPLKEVAQAVSGFGGVRGRMEVLSHDPLVIVDFAHTPDGMEKVFESFPSKEIVALFGAGGDRDREKRQKMGAVASRFCKRIYLTSDNPRSEDPREIIEEIARGIGRDLPVIKEPDRRVAIERALSELKEGEILLVLGKGDEEYIEVGGERIPFSDIEFIKEILVK